MKIDKDKILKILDDLRVRGTTGLEETLTEIEKEIGGKSLDPESIKSLKEIISSSHRIRIGQYLTPQSIVDFMVDLAPIKDNDVVLDPTCGTGSYLVSANRKAKNLKLYGVDIDQIIIRWAKFFTRASNTQAVLLTQNSLEELKGIPKANVLFANIPWGGRAEPKIQNKFNVKVPSLEGLFLQRFSDLVKEGGWIVTVVPEGVLFSTQLEKVRDYLLKHCLLKAVISLPTKSFMPYSGIKTSILVLERRARPSKVTTYMAVITDIDKQAEIIVNEFKNLESRKGNLSVGFFPIKLENIWNVERYQYLQDFAHLKEIKIVSLGDIAEIINYKGEIYSDDVAITQFGKVLAKEEIDDQRSKKIIIRPRSKSVKAQYIYAYLNSELGKKQIKAATLGSTIPYITLNSISSIKIPLIPLSDQQLLVSNFLSAKLNISILSDFLKDAQRSIGEDIFAIDRPEIYARLEKLVSHIDQFPQPIASLQAKIRNAPNFTQKFKLTITLFELVFRYTSIINLSDLEQNFKFNKFEELVFHTGDYRKPSFGQWKNIFEISIDKIQKLTRDGPPPFIREIGDIDVKKLRKLLQNIVTIRNKKEGHATLSEYEYQELSNELIPQLQETLNILSFLKSYELVRVEEMHKHQNDLSISVKKLMGETNQFERQKMPVRTIVDTNSVHLADNTEGSFLNLHPLVLCEPCSECHREEVLIYDTNKPGVVEYLGFESGHHSRKESEYKDLSSYWK